MHTVWAASLTWLTDALKWQSHRLTVLINYICAFPEATCQNEWRVTSVMSLVLTKSTLLWKLQCATYLGLQDILLAATTHKKATSLIIINRKWFSSRKIRRQSNYLGKTQTITCFLGRLWTAPSFPLCIALRKNGVQSNSQHHSCFFPACF